MILSLRYTLPLLFMTACLVPRTPHEGPRETLRPAPVKVRLVFTGDVMQHMPQVEAARRDSLFDYTPTFEALRPRFEGADLAVVNLETTLTHTRDYTGYPRFRSPLALASALHEAGVDVAVMANNHCCDGGDAGVRTTTAELDRLGIRRTGVFTDSLDRARNNPLYITLQGIRFAILNYTYSTNGIPVPRGIGVNQIDTVRMASDLAQAHLGGAQCVVVCIHWGEEYERRENKEQRALAGFMRRHGADVVVGSHPHVIQPYEADSAHVVFYSLGNFVSNQRRRYCDGGLVAEVEVTRWPDERITYSAGAVPVWVALPAYRVLPPEAADTMTLPAAYRIFRADAAQTLGTAL